MQIMQGVCACTMRFVVEVSMDRTRIGCPAGYLRFLWIWIGF